MDGRMTYERLLKLQGEALRQYVQNRLQEKEPLDPPLDWRRDEGPAQFVLGGITSREAGRSFTESMSECLPQLWAEVAGQWIEAIRQPELDTTQNEWRKNQEYLRRLALVTAKTAQIGENLGLQSSAVREAYRPIQHLLVMSGNEYGKDLLDENTEAQLVHTLALLQPLVRDSYDLGLWEGYWERSQDRFYGPAFLGMLWSGHHARQVLSDHLGKALGRSKKPRATFSLRNVLLSYLQRKKEEGAVILGQAAFSHGQEAVVEIGGMLQKAGISRSLVASFQEAAQGFPTVTSDAHPAKEGSFMSMQTKSAS